MVDGATRTSAGAMLVSDTRNIYPKLALLGVPASPMSGLLDDPKYTSFLARTHPNLDICSDRFVAPTYVASFDISEVLISNFFKTVIAIAGHIAPRIPKPRALFVGTPFERYEQTKLLDQIKDPGEAAHALRHAATQQSLDLVVCTNVSVSHPGIQTWIDAGFLALPSFPDMVVDVKATSFEGHLANLAPRARESIRRNLRLFDRAGFRLQRLDETALSAATLHTAYRQFYDRAIVRWHPYSESYFAEIAGLDERAHVTAAVTSSEEIVGFIINFADNNCWQAGRIGVVPSHFRKSAIYFRLLYHSIEEAILHGAKTLSLEPTGYLTKRRLGAHMNPLVNLVLGVSPLWKMLFKTSGFLARRALAHLEDRQLLEAHY